VDIDGEGDGARTPHLADDLLTGQEA